MRRRLGLMGIGKLAWLSGRSAGLKGCDEGLSRHSRSDNMSNEPESSESGGNDALGPLIEAVQQLVEANMELSAALAEILRDGNLPEGLANSAASHLLKVVLATNQAHTKALSAHAASQQ